MFSRGSRKRLSGRSLTALGEPERGQPCNACGDQCPGFALHKWSQCRDVPKDMECVAIVLRTLAVPVCWNKKN
ncbi:unnamed protein product [Caretta caretta]